jgi:hypothetical protein
MSLGSSGPECPEEEEKSTVTCGGVLPVQAAEGDRRETELKKVLINMLMQ